MTHAPILAGKLFVNKIMLIKTMRYYACFVSLKNFFIQEFADNVWEHLFGSVSLVLRNDKLHSFLVQFPHQKGCGASPFLYLFIAWLATLISTVIQISPLCFGAITKGETQVVGPLTFSIISFSSSSLIFSNNFSLRL